jgi:uncharacterized protein
VKTQRSEATAIDIVKGPGEHGNQYVFITADTAQINIGKFVFYRLMQLGDKTLDILGKISACTLVDHLPALIFADTEIDPGTFAGLISFKNDLIYYRAIFFEISLITVLDWIAIANVPESPC